MVDHIDRLGEEGPHAGQGRSMSQSCRQMGFAQAVTGNKNKSFVLFYKSELHGFQDLGLGNGGRVFPVKGIEGFSFRKPGAAQSRLDLALELVSSVGG